MDILPYKREYLTEIVHLLYGSVHTLCKDDYTEEELEVWMPKKIDYERLGKSFSPGKTFVVMQHSLILAFADMDRDGYLNRLYTRAGFEGKGIGKTLLSFMESRAREMGNGKMVLMSSITARPFYEACGYRVKREKKKEKNGVTLFGYIMEKRL